MGELTEMFPHLVGEWKTDKKAFEKICDQNKELGII